MNAKIIICFCLAFHLTSQLGGQEIETVVQAGHYGSVTAMTYSPDGRFISTGSSDKTIILWRASDGKQIRTLKGNSSAISKIEFNPQGTSLLSLGVDGTCIVFNINTGKILKQMKPENDRFTCASFHPDGQQIITGAKKSFISVWDLGSGERTMDIKAIPRPLYSEKLYEYPESGSVSFSRDGNYIVAGVSDYTTIVWDVKTGTEIRKYKRAKATCTSCLSEACITSDNKHIITAYSDSVKIFDMKSGALIRELYGQGATPENLVISTDNRLVAGIEYGVAEIWNIQTGKLVLKAGNYSTNKILSLAISPDGK